MAQVYSTYEAKSRFSEILRKVRSGQRVVISYHGREVAEVRPLETDAPSFDRRLHRLEEEGVLVPPTQPRGELRPLARKPGALRRFLDSRD